MKNNNNLSIYIHTPFCKSKCNYCNFYSINPENINGAELQKIYNIYNGSISSHSSSPIHSHNHNFNFSRSHNFDPNTNHNNIHERTLSTDNRNDRPPNTNHNNIHGIYLQSLIKELKIISEKYKLGGNFTHGRIVKTIYFGGGTPSVMGINFFDEIINNIYKTFTVSDNPEITAEVNPESADFNKLKSLRSLGINRLSIGAQSFNDNVLKIAGRLHSSADILRCVNDSRKCGFNNISLDLILGLPGQTAEILQKDINYLTSIRPEHISAYILSIEKGSKFYKNLKKMRMQSEENCESSEYEQSEYKQSKHEQSEYEQREYEQREYKESMDDELADFYITASEKFSNNGYKHYEISNFALNGFESKHNINYWERGEYIGLGPAASSFIKLRTEHTANNHNNARGSNNTDIKLRANHAIRYNAHGNNVDGNIDNSSGNAGSMSNYYPKYNNNGNNSDYNIGSNYNYLNNEEVKKKLEIRITNEPNLIKYINKIVNFEKKMLQQKNKKNKLIKCKIEEFKTDEEILAKKDIINEIIFLSLRTHKGINVKIIYKFADRKIIDAFIKAGFAEIYATGDILHIRYYLRLTLKGMLISSEIFSKILL